MLTRACLMLVGILLVKQKTVGGHVYGCLRLVEVLLFEGDDDVRDGFVAFC